MAAPGTLQPIAVPHGRRIAAYKPPFTGSTALSASGHLRTFAAMRPLRLSPCRLGTGSSEMLHAGNAHRMRGSIGSSHSGTRDFDLVPYMSGKVNA